MLPSLLGMGKQRFTSEEVKVPCEAFDLLASTQEAIGETEADCYEECADLEDECVLFKGRHDTDGCLSLGFVEVQDGWTSPSVSARRSALRSSAGLNSLSPSLPLAVASVKTIFVKGVDGNTVVHRVKGHTVVGDLLDGTVDVWVTRSWKKVDLEDTVSHVGVGSHDTLRCGGRLRGGAQRYRQTTD